MSEQNNGLADMAGIEQDNKQNKIFAEEQRDARKLEGAEVILRREALLVLGYAPDHKGELTIPANADQLFEATLGRILLRYLNQRARAN